MQAAGLPSSAAGEVTHASACLIVTQVRSDLKLCGVKRGPQILYEQCKDGNECFLGCDMVFSAQQMTDLHIRDLRCL